MKIIDIFKRPTIDEMLEYEMLKARRGLIDAEADLDRARCLVAYYRDRITRMAARGVTIPSAGTAVVLPLVSDTRADTDIALTHPVASRAH